MTVFIWALLSVYFTFGLFWAIYFTAYWAIRLLRNWSRYYKLDMLVITVTVFFVTLFGWPWALKEHYRDIKELSRFWRIKTRKG